MPFVSFDDAMHGIYASYFVNTKVKSKQLALMVILPPLQWGTTYVPQTQTDTQGHTHTENITSATNIGGNDQFIVILCDCMID